MALYRIGMDLSKVTFPTFVLEPRSMLERITDFMSHPDLIFGSVIFPRYTCRVPDAYLPPRAENLEEPEERFIQILRYYLSGWHVKPKGVKKPYVVSMPLPAVVYMANSAVPDTTLYLASSFAVDMITKTELLATTSLNKVGSCLSAI